MPVELWNRRPAEDALRARVAELEEKPLAIANFNNIQRIEKLEASARVNGGIMLDQAKEINDLRARLERAVGALREISKSIADAALATEDIGT